MWEKGYPVAMKFFRLADIRYMDDDLYIDYFLMGQITLDKPVSSPSPGTDRTLDILEVLSDHPSGLTLAELVRATELPQNSVFRIANVLQTRGYVSRDETDKRFILSNKLFGLGQPRVNEKSLVMCGYDTLKQLRDDTGETAQMMVRSGRKGVVLEQAAGRHAVKVMGETGLQVPLYSCAPGKAILAWLPEPEFDAWLSSVTLKSFTANTLSTRKKLVDGLKQIRGDGYALDLAEGLEGIRCAAAPILNAHDYPVAAITVMAPIFRLPEEDMPELGLRCIKAAQQIREKLLS